MTTEKSAICVFFSAEFGDSVVLVIPTAVFLSVIVEIERHLLPSFFPLVSQYLLYAIPVGGQQML